MKYLACALLILGLGVLSCLSAEEPPAADGPNLEVSFAEGQWNRDDWLFVRSPRWEEHGRWIQEKEGIANAVPEDIDPEAIPSDRMADVYASLLYKQPFHGNVRFTTECQFDQEMAPLLVFSKELTEVYHEHLEVVLYNAGLNLWHHYYENGRPSWKRIGFLEARFEPGKKYELSARFEFSSRGTTLIIECDGHKFGTMLDGDWPRDYYAGITACEGVNHFYGVSAETAEK
ncbi:MAG: hypothetical protein IJG02_05805 [Thermoguttaceae bacterium]|nr:hypothetical protein [Thermoguttaceae bacterium]